MNRLLTTALFAALLLPQLANARGPMFEASELSYKAARHIEKPVLIERDELRDHLRALADDLNDLRRVADQLRSRRARRALDRQIAQMERRLRRARDLLREAPHLHRTRRQQARPVQQPVAQPARVQNTAATSKQMTGLLLSMEGASFRDDKMRVIRQAAGAHWFTTEQARSLAEQLAFGDDRVNALVILYPKLIDPQNAHSLYSLLAHPSDRDALEQRINALQ